MKQTLLTATIVLIAAFANAQSVSNSSSTFNDPNNPSPVTIAESETNNNSQVSEREAMMPIENRIDPSAQMKFVYSNGEGSSTASRKVLSASAGSSNAFAANGNTVYNYANETNTNQNVALQRANNNSGEYTASPAFNEPSNSNTGTTTVKLVNKNSTTVINERYIDGQSRNATETASIYPNPAISQTSVILEKATSQKVAIVVQDINGTIVLRSNYAPGGNSFPLDITTLRRGLYNVSISLGREKTLQVKMNVAH